MHVEKYTKSAVGHLLRHYNRTANHISNQDICADKTKFNYNLCKREESDLSYYKKRISQVKCQNRADVKALNITVQMYPCSEGTDTGSPAL